MRLLLLLTPGLFLAQAPVPSARLPVACVADSDCVITDFGGCCPGCCGRGRYAIAKDELERRRQRCAAVDCENPNCEAVRCKDPEDARGALRAECRAATCVAVPVAAPVEGKAKRPVPVECRTAADCTVIYPTSPGCGSSPCGCCPGSEPVAVSVDDPRARPPRPPQPGSPVPLKKDEEVPFGLSPGSSARRPSPPTPPACSPCRGPRPARAECNAGRCALAPHALER